jgi:hypothetical protein
MTIYLVYGSDGHDICNESYVKKAFTCETEAEKYCKLNSKFVYDRDWYVEEMKLERPPNLD